METIKLGKNTVEIYNGAENLPIRRYQKFNKFLLNDNQVGSDFSDFEKRTARSIEFLKKGMQNEAINELENRRLMVYNAFMEYTPKGKALAILVHKINDVVFTDYSDETLEHIINELDRIGFTKKQLDEKTDEVKKKLNPKGLFTFLKSLKISKKKSTTLS